MNEEKLAAIRALKTANGQIEGIIRMIEDERYCIDVSNQILAASAVLKRANLLILKQHMHHCLLEAAAEGDGDAKVDELLGVLSKLIDK